MIRKDRTVIAPQCQFGVKCSYLANEVEGSGEPCRYKHPKSHYEALQRRGTMTSGGRRPPADPLIARSQVQSFMRPSPASFPSLSTTSAAPSPPTYHRPVAPIEVEAESNRPVRVFICEQITCVRPKPSFSTNGSLELPEGAWVAGEEAIIASGNVEWLELSGNRGWVPLVSVRPVPVSMRPRVYRVWQGPARVSSRALPNYPDNGAGVLAVGSVVEADASTSTAVRIASGWISRNCCDELADEAGLYVWRIMTTHAIQPMQSPTGEGGAFGSPLAANTVVEGTTKLLNSGRLAGGGWLPMKALSELKTSPIESRRYYCTDETAIRQWPDDKGTVVGRLAECAVVVDCEWNDWGHLSDSRGWVQISADWEMLAVGGGRMLAEEDCVVCLERPAGVALLHGDTMHVCCCSICAAQLERCPLCRAVVDRVVAVAGRGD